MDYLTELRDYIDVVILQYKTDTTLSSKQRSVLYKKIFKLNDLLPKVVKMKEAGVTNEDIYALLAYAKKPGKPGTTKKPRKQGKKDAR